MPEIAFKCPVCSFRFKADADSIGPSPSCPKCGEPLDKQGKDCPEPRTDLDCLHATEGLVETIEEARIAISAILLKKPELRRRLDETTADSKPERKRVTKPCVTCGEGTLHYVGRNVLPDGRLGLGGLIVCDTCGFHTTSR